MDGTRVSLHAFVSHTCPGFLPVAVTKSNLEKRGFPEGQSSRGTEFQQGEEDREGMHSGGSGKKTDSIITTQEAEREGEEKGGGERAREG